jgi:alkylated DNA nucleotide flippase Atl1
MISDTQQMQNSVFEIVNSIPKGKVSSYGEVGAVIGVSGWHVGRILSGLKEELWDSVLWQRVVAKNGFISSVKLGFRGELQKQLLEQESIQYTENIVDMAKHGLDREELSRLYVQRQK